MKEIYSFSINKQVKKEVKEETDKGTLLKEVQEETPIKIIFKRPSRAESEEADVVSAVEYSESIRKGILTKPLLERFYDEKGGFLAENYESKYSALLARFFQLEHEFQGLNQKNDKTVEDKERVNMLGGEFIKVQRDLQILEAERNALFQNTAETRAQQKTIFWLTLFLTYIQEDENDPAVPFFTGNTFEEKRDDYDKKMEGTDDFIFRVIDKMSFFMALWYMGRASTKEDFKQIEDNLTPSILKEEKEPAEEIEKAEKPSAPPEVAPLVKETTETV